MLNRNTKEQGSTRIYKRQNIERGQRSRETRRSCRGYRGRGTGLWWSHHLMSSSCSETGLWLEWDPSESFASGLISGGDAQSGRNWEARRVAKGRVYIYIIFRCFFFWLLSLFPISVTVTNNQPSNGKSLIYVHVKCMLMIFTFFLSYSRSSDFPTMLLLHSKDRDF